jgi:N-acetyl-1-D-myo-inositol-2-amino-2-deoxy-alpha-D-glucopyranoside deacetylase
MAALGVTDHRFLGAPARRFVDSGMAYGPDGAVVPAPWSPSGAFALTPVDDPAALLADVVREVRPHVVVTYGPDGGYGHPDHVQAHRVTMRAVDLAAGGDGAWDVPKVYWVVRPDQEPTTRVDATAFTAAKVAALRAHETQLLIDAAGTTFALSNDQAAPIDGVEHYRRVRGPAGPADAVTGLETDLFGGLG